LLAGLAGAAVPGCGGADEPQVVVYASVDRNFAEPVLEAFEQATGIRVLAAYDVEASKTTGMVNRLLAEKDRPRADVFWSGEFAQTVLLKREGALAAYDSPQAADLPEAYRDPDRQWTGFAGRARAFIVNTDLVAPGDYPRSIEDLARPACPPDKVAMANPLFGTTCTHAAALYAAWGPERAQAFFRKVQAGGIRIAAGNGAVRDLVASGEAFWGLTDTDDIAGAVARGRPVAAVFPDQGADGLGTLVIPNTVALVAGAPHPEAAQRLIDYLLSPEVERRLIDAGWCHVPSRPTQARPLHVRAEGVRPMAVPLADVCGCIERAKAELAGIFVQ